MNHSGSGSGTARARIGLAQVCAAGVLWGTGGLVVQLVRERVPMSVLTISAWRMGLAAVVLLVAVAATRTGPALADLLRRHPGRAVVVGLSTAAYQALYFGAVVLAGVTVATVISLGLAPVLLTLADSLRARRAPTRRRVAVLAAALVGLVLVSLAAGGSGGPHPVAGVLVSVASGSAYAFATARGERLARDVDPLPLTTATTTVGALGLLPLLVVADGPRSSANQAVLGLLVYLGVLTMALAYGLLYAGLRTTTGAAATVATLLEPVTAAVAAAVVLGERVGALGVVGTLLVLAAVVGLAEDPPLDPVEPSTKT